MNPVLYVEDEPDDVFFLQRAWKQAGAEKPLESVSGGNAAREWIAGAIAGAGGAVGTPRPMPCLLLLDLNLPDMSGFELLKWIRAQRAAAVLPVIVFTSSSLESDITRAMAEGANGYLVKTGRLEELARMMRAIDIYWLQQDRFARAAGAIRSASAKKPER